MKKSFLIAIIMLSVFFMTNISKARSTNGLKVSFEEAGAEVELK